MSFGTSASGATLCVCGSGERTDGCCGPLLDGVPAPTAERLMRSRYTAFVRGDTAHLVRTWHPRTRPATLETDPGLRWLGLEVLEAEEDGDTAIVEFRARWADGGERGVLHERSRFERRGGRWMYLDGDVR